METQKPKKDDKLPIKYVLDNLLFGCATIWNWLLLPIFIYNCTKGNHSNKKIVMPVQLSYFIFEDSKIGPAFIEKNALWDYTIPTHNMLHFWRFEEIEGGEKRIGLETALFVPQTQAFYADVILRQWANELGFIVTSPVQYQGRIPSTRYQNQRYEPQGVPVKNKSVDMFLGSLLWGHKLKTVKYTKKVKLGKTYR